MGKPVIVMVGNHACIRVDKMALPLIQKGYEVHLISRKDAIHSSYYKTHAKCHHVGQFLEAIRIYGNRADIFHVHNEPSWFVSMVKETTEKSVVPDVHDSFLVRTTPDESLEKLKTTRKQIRISTEERNNFQLADGLVFPSEPMRKNVCAEFGLNQPSIALPPYLPLQLYAWDTREWLGGICYEGRVDLKEENAKEAWAQGFKYSDYEDLARQFDELGINFHVYPARNDKDFLKVYDDICFTHVPIPYNELMQNISRHDWGLVGNINHTPEWEIAFPNKLFEYIGAQVPIVAMNAPVCGEFVKKHGIGIEVSSAEELKERWSEHRECRKNLIQKRQQFIMENHIGELENLYGKVWN